jgi:N-acetylmuramoyl-L-alanine amidase
MPEHIVRQGDCLVSIAKKYGISDWGTIYNHRQNSGFRKKRPNPNVIYPGDRLFVPEKEQKWEEGNTNRRHRFRAKGTKGVLRIILRDTDEQPYANKRFSLQVNELTFEGRTNGEGLLEQTVPSDRKEGQLYVWLSDNPGSEPMTWSVRIGHLDPKEYNTGIKGRLANLGYLANDPGNKMNQATKESIRAFQADQGLPVTGEIDEATRNKLIEKHAGT